MYKELDSIDIERLRSDLDEFLKGAYFAGGFGAALVESIDLTYASTEEVVRIAISKGFNISNYIIEDGNKLELEYNK